MNVEIQLAGVFMKESDLSEKKQIEFIWKDPLPCIVDFGYELKRLGLNCVVDLGCRVGGNTIALSQIGLRLIALDPQKSNLDTVNGRAYDKHLEIKTIQYESGKLPFENDSIDAFVTTTAIHHLLPNESKQIVSEIHRTLVPGGRILVAVLSDKDYRYGTGNRIDENTFENTLGPEIKNLHQFFSKQSLLDLFDKFIPECNPYIVPSTYIFETENGKEQGKLLVGRFFKGILSKANVIQSINDFSNTLENAQRSVEIVFSLSSNSKFSRVCDNFLFNSLVANDSIYCQCIIIGNNIDMVSYYNKLKHFTNNEHVSIAFSNQTNTSYPDIVIVDGIKTIIGTNADYDTGLYYYDSNPTYVNLFRQQLLSLWKKSSVLINNGIIISNLENDDNNYLSTSESNSKIKEVNFNYSRKKHIRIGIAQIDLSDFLSISESQLYKPDLLKLPNAIEHIIIKAANHNLDILLLPELSGDYSLNEKIQKAANVHNITIVGGSYYDNRRVNCCPVAIPGRTEPYIVEKIHPSPFEISPNKDAGILEGNIIYVFRNTSVGSFGVLICADFLNDSLVSDVCDKDIDFLCVLSMNNDSSRFFEKMNSKCKNCQRGIYILYSNCLFSTDGFKTDGSSSLFGFMDKLYLSKLHREKDMPLYQIISLKNDTEGFIIANLDIEERRPTIRGPETKPNITDIEIVEF